MVKRKQHIDKLQTNSNRQETKYDDLCSSDELTPLEKQALIGGGAGISTRAYTNRIHAILPKPSRPVRQNPPIYG